MRINSILVENFRAITSVELANLSDAIVIAGPNGCGKSSIFDAIRLVKSAYGQYRNNEYSSWFSEFQIDINKLQTDAKRILNDPLKSMNIEIEFSLNQSEIDFLKNNAIDIYKKLRWSQLMQKRTSDGDVVIRDPKTKLTDGAIVDEQARLMAVELLSAIEKKCHIARLSMEPGEAPSVVRSPVLELMFSVYQPQDLGVIDYQPPNRSYAREPIGNLSLQIQDASASKSAQHALYDTQNKYTGVKTEMAQSYVREILAERAGVSIPEKNTLKSTLDELFSIFFPGKQFLGAIPTPTGGLEFPVQLENGRKHDINELSSGEKEVLLGYLRLRNNAPKNSILLLDEPELHLNPRLARGLPRFYQKHLGQELDNQIWLVSHSDAILRAAVQDPSYSVFHMQPCSQTPEGVNQADRICASEDVEDAVINLVGDLAAYNPRSKVVLLEGEDSETDARIISELFPIFSERVNLVSLGSKRNVRYTHDILEKAAQNGKLEARFFSIVDKDFDGDAMLPSARRFEWDVYHVENFLLVPEFLRSALKGITLNSIDLSEEEILLSLRACAEETIDDTTRIKMTSYINSQFMSTISLSFDPKLKNSQGFREAVTRSCEKLNNLVSKKLTNDQIASLESGINEELKKSLTNDTWLREFRGRNILRRFAGKHGVHYEVLRNLVVNKMREAQFKPKSMELVVDQILSDGAQKSVLGSG